MATNQMTPEGRQALSEKTKARWAARREAKEDAETRRRGDAETEEDAETRRRGDAQTVRISLPPAPSVKQEDEIHPVTRCTGCGWEVHNLSWREAITKHPEVRPWCTRVCLVHPSKQFLKAEALKQMARTGKRRTV